MELQPPPIMDQREKPRLSSYEADERAAEAVSLLVNPVLTQAFNDIYSRAVTDLLGAGVGSLTATAAHASMKAIQDLRKQLEQYVTDGKVRQKFNKG